MKHKEGYFKGVADFNLYYQCWLPDQKPVAILLVAHGFAEHSGRYTNLVNFFVPKGYDVYALDHRGHGRSDGERYGSKNSPIISRTSRPSSIWCAGRILMRRFFWSVTTWERPSVPPMC